MPEAEDLPRGSRPLLPPGVLILLKGGDLSQEIDETVLRAKPRLIRMYPIVFGGADAAGLVDKKLVIIQP